MTDSNVEEVTIKEEKPKNPKRVAWAKKLGQMNKGKKKVKEEEESDAVTNNTIYFAPLALAAVGIVAYVVFYSKNEVKENSTESKSEQPKTKRSLDLNL